MPISTWLPTYHAHVDRSIASFFAKRYVSALWVERQYEEAMRYAVEWGGKRLRPILAMVAYEYARWVQEEFWNTNLGQELLTSIIGIEMIHCYTLVHDDLPSMDNDDLRRGRPTIWKMYGEPMALLVGDSLQTVGFELLASTGDARVVSEMARALGDLGVARGQVRDTFLRHDELSLSELFRIHDEKTGIFIANCLVCGARLGGADETMTQSLRSLGMLLGRAFQIQDDILDAEWDDDAVGKKTRKDVILGKGIVSLIGLQESKYLLQELEQEMTMLRWELTDSRFGDIIEFVVYRQH